MKAISQPFIQQLARAFGIRGGAQLNLNEDVLLVSILADLRERQVAMVGGGSWGASPGPTIGEYALLTIANPLTSSCVAVVWSTSIFSAVAGVPLSLSSGKEGIDPVPPGGGAPVQTRPSDTRRMESTATRNQVQARSGSQAMLTIAAAQQQLTYGVNPVEYESARPLAVLGPGGWLSWQALALNANITGNFSWDEYELGGL